MKIDATIGQTKFMVTLQDKPTSQDFIALLPLTLNLKDFGGKEKISDLPKKLTVANAPAGSRPLTGDIAYYASWGNLAIFYEGSAYANGLIILGNIDANPDVIKNAHSITITMHDP